MSMYEPGDEVRYDGIPPFEGTILEYTEDHEMAVNDLVDETTRRGPAYVILTDIINERRMPVITWVWADDRCLVSAE